MADHLSKEPLSSIDNMQSIKCCLDSIETPKLVELYRPLVVRCVKVNDVVHYLDDVIHTRRLSFSIFFILLIFFFKLFDDFPVFSEGFLLVADVFTISDQLHIKTFSWKNNVQSNKFEFRLAVVITYFGLVYYQQLSISLTLHASL